MKNVVYSAMFAAALTGTAVSAAAQTNQAAAPAPALYKGLTMKAEQQCPRFPRQGVTITVETLNESGTGGNVSVQVDCWGKVPILVNGRYFGSIALEGGSVKLRFYAWTTRYGADLSGGTWQTNTGGQQVLVFGKSELRAGRNLYTDELVFR